LLGFIDYQAQAEVYIWVTPTLPSSNGEFSGYLGEELAFLGISGRFLPLYGRPFRMP